MLHLSFGLEETKREWLLFDDQRGPLPDKGWFENDEELKTGVALRKMLRGEWRLCAKVNRYLVIKQ